MDDPGPLDEIAALRSRLTTMTRIAEVAVEALMRLADYVCPECNQGDGNHPPGCRTGEALRMWKEREEE